MKQNISLSIATLLLIVIAASCIKSTSSKKFKIYTPQFEAKSTYLQKIKKQEPKAVTKIGKHILYKNYMLVSSINQDGIHVFDVANPASPQNIGFINIPYNDNITIKNDIMYANSGPDLLVLTIANNMEVSVVNYINKINANYYYYNYYQLSDSSKIVYAFAERDTVIKSEYSNYNAGGSFIEDLMGNNKMATFSATGNVSNTTSSGGGASIAGSMAMFVTVADNMYIVNRNSMLTFNLNHIDGITQISKLTLTNNVETIYPFKDKLFIGTTTGMLVYGLAAGTGIPSFISNFLHAQSCDPVVTDGDYAYVTLRSGTICNSTLNQMDIVDVKDITKPKLVKSYTLSNPFGLCKQDKYVYICDNNAGVKIYDVTDPNNATLVKTLNIDNTRDVFVYNNVAYIGTTESILLYDVTNTSAPKKLSSIN